MEPSHIKTDSTKALAALNEKRIFFDSGGCRSFAFRKKALKALFKSIKAHEPRIIEALAKDLHKSEAESYATEIGILYMEINHTLAHLRDWIKTIRQPTPLALQPSSSHIKYQPKGVVLIISPWNFPFLLCLAPLVGAIAAGNCALLKPSEDAPYTSSVIHELISQTFPEEYISVVLGAGQEIVPDLLEQFTFNHIFFTGSPGVGSIIAAQAAKKLTPVTLELGGKSPGIVSATANLKVAARRLVSGKFTNAGQICVAPDYLLVEKSVKDAFVVEVRKALTSFFGEDPRKSPDYARIINQKRFDIIAGYLHKGRILVGGITDKGSLYIAPTLIDEVDMNDPVMQEEIFGPVWPIITWESRAELLEISRRNRYPLACYFFGSDKKLENFVMENIEFGGGCVNNTLLYWANQALPIGGVMSSGSGQYHGWYGFTCFSHAKSILRSGTWIDPSVRYPPFSKTKIKLLRWFFR